MSHVTSSLNWRTTKMENFYWKKRDRYDHSDYYVNPDGKIMGELYTSKFDNTFAAHAWDESEHRFILLGRFINQETATRAVEEYCQDNY